MKAQVNFDSLGGSGGNYSMTSSSKFTTTATYGVMIQGKMTITTQIENGETLFTINPAPSTQQTVSAALKLSSPVTDRDVIVKTNGDVVLSGSAMFAGYTWDVKIPITL